MAATLVNFIPGIHTVNHAAVATAGIVTIGLVVAGFAANSALGRGEEQVAPANRFSLRGLFEVITEFITNLSDSVIGVEGRHFVPLFAAVFTFVYANNMLGMLPGLVPATENMNMTSAMAILVFLGYNFVGIQHHGIGYIKHFLGPMPILIPFMLPLEILSHLVRPFSLSMRLSNVLAGDHAVVGVFVDLTKVIGPLPFYMLGLIVAFVQAFVFTLLSMVYVKMANDHAH
jgi:F-type H+-transporting ATPase subunit a